MRRHALLVTAALLALVSPARAQWFSLTPEPGTVTVGDPVTFRAHLILSPKAIPLAVPAFAAGASGVRIVSADSLRRIGIGEFTGRVRVAFYRPGAQELPPLVLHYQGEFNVRPTSVTSEPVPVEISAVLPPGNLPLKDIRDVERPPSLLPFGLAGAVLIAVGAGVLWRRRPRGLVPHAVSAAAAIAEAGTAPLTACDLALARLAELERAAWPARGRTARQYDEVVATLRDYLEATGVRARERTTSELLRELSAPRGGELRGRARAVLHAADAVKFARDEPDAAAAAEHLGATRAWIVDWDSHALR